MIAEKLLDPRDARDKSTLQEIVATGDEMSQLMAARRLLEVESSRQLESVISRGIASETEAVRQLAVKAASDQPALRAMIAVHLSSKDANVQLAALSAIADLGQLERFGDVANYLASPVPAVSAAAARTLVTLDPIGAEPVLTEALKSPKSHVRVNGAAMLLAIAAHRQPR
jgi:HEAT repeat protein